METPYFFEAEELKSFVSTFVDVFSNELEWDEEVTAKALAYIFDGLQLLNQVVVDRREDED